MDSLEIRPARPEDADALFDLLTQFATSYRPDRAAFDAHLPLLIASDTALLRVAAREGQVLGYLLGFQFLTLYANGPLLEVQELMVDPAYRGQGVGRRLLAAAIETAWERGCVEVTVPTRRAGPYYERLGFIETAAYYKLKRS
jgi:GNAT superfamily N-acetyltransferase